MILRLSLTMTVTFHPSLKLLSVNFCIEINSSNSLYRIYVNACVGIPKRKQFSIKPLCITQSVNNATNCSFFFHFHF
jgi:hypothetical protein